jgi:L-rhamnose mutarotase
MQRVCFTLQVKKDCIDEYKRQHLEVWPEMLQALRATGWQNYSLFLREDGLLIGYLETEDFEKARAAMAALDVNTQWQSAMTPFFEDVRGTSPDQAMKPIAEIFHLESQTL